MKKFSLYSIFFLIFITNLFSNEEVWKDLNTHDEKYYSFKVPSAWRQIPTNEKGLEYFFEASGISFPSLYNNHVVKVVAFITKQNCIDLDDCKFKCVSGYRYNSDRVFDNGKVDSVQKIKLASFQDAYFVKTQFFRVSNGLNQSRYDLIVFSRKAGAGYVFTFSVQYFDNTYHFEEVLNLDYLAKKLFGYFVLRA